jgi:hypothetical protein
MILSMGAAGTMVGAVFLAWACASPAHKRSLEHWGGGLFLGGIALLSFGFAMI